MVKALISWILDSSLATLCCPGRLWYLLQMGREVARRAEDRWIVVPWVCVSAVDISVLRSSVVQSQRDLAVMTVLILAPTWPRRSFLQPRLELSKSLPLWPTLVFACTLCFLRTHRPCPSRGVLSLR